MPCTEIMLPNNLAIDVLDCDGGTVLHCRESKGCSIIQHRAGDANLAFFFLNEGHTIRGRKNIERAGLAVLNALTFPRGSSKIQPSTASCELSSFSCKYCCYT